MSNKTLTIPPEIKLPLTLEAIEEGYERDIAIRKSELLAQTRTGNIDASRTLMRDIGNLLSREIHMYKRT